MSKFFRALEQADRDRSIRRNERPDPARTERLPTPRLPAVRPPDRRTNADPASTGPAGPVDDMLDERLVSLVTPAGYAAEQYRALRHMMEQWHKNAGLQVVAISSPGTGDGKTTTAINLAGALAQAPGARVLLIDADLRRSAVGTLLGLSHPDRADLVSAIVDPRLTLDDVALPRKPFNLSVICAGPPLHMPYEVLKSARLGALLDEARRRYDYVVLDTAPLTPFPDCRVIGQWVDGFLVVVGANHTPRRLFEEALTALDTEKLLGIVFNGDERVVWREQAGTRSAAAIRGPGHQMARRLLGRVAGRIGPAR
jgi:capsular exopolysaccharide synthesis family protein